MNAIFNPPKQRSKRKQRNRKTGGRNYCKAGHSARNNCTKTIDRREDGGHPGRFARQKILRNRGSVAGMVRLGRSLRGGARGTASLAADAQIFVRCHLRFANHLKPIALLLLEGTAEGVAASLSRRLRDIGQRRTQERSEKG
ncbi:MAG: hypothetical protein ACXIT4_09095 [Erythrobacter sp.]